jgi:hypothetical protein
VIALPLWFVFLLFAFWGIGSLNSAIARVIRYKMYQRDSWLLSDAVEKFLMAIAFSLGSLTVLPHPVYNFEWLREYARYAWLFAFVPFAIGVWLDWHSLSRIRQQKGKP